MAMPPQLADKAQKRAASKCAASPSPSDPSRASLPSMTRMKETLFRRDYVEAILVSSLSVCSGVATEARVKFVAGRIV
jgi:hypothetical protein